VSGQRNCDRYWGLKGLNCGLFCLDDFLNTGMVTP
jgi:hypothetical protein